MVLDDISCRLATQAACPVSWHSRITYSSNSSLYFLGVVISPAVDAYVTWIQGFFPTIVGGQIVFM